jgi:hypothetical protein
MTRQWSPWSVPTRSREDNGSWRFSFTRESEAMDFYTIPFDRTEALAAALGVPIDVVVAQLQDEKAESALIDAWQALVGLERDEGIARLESAGLAPRSVGSWTPFGDYGVYRAPTDDAAPESS